MSSPRSAGGSEAELGFEPKFIWVQHYCSYWSSDAANLPHMVKGRAVNMSTITAQGSQQVLAPEIGEGVGQLGSCPEGQVKKEPWGFLLEGNSFSF